MVLKRQVYPKYMCAKNKSIHVAPSCINFNKIRFDALHFTKTHLFAQTWAKPQNPVQYSKATEAQERM